MTFATGHPTMTQPNILVVDDDPEICRLLGKYLEGQGFRCQLAANRRQCQQRLADSRVDLVVLDVMLPDGSGLDICRQIKDEDRNGGKTLAELVDHMANDDLVGWGWHPGKGREPVPGTQKQFGELYKAWAATGAHCPDS